MLTEVLTSALVLIGAAFVLLGAVGLARLPDLFTRLHGPTKATTLGVGAMVVGSMIHFNAQGDGVSLRDLTIVLFLFITAPVSAHMIAKAALKERERAPQAEPPAQQDPSET
ncbi:Na+/H+ antiporter subunit G [Blastochloris tepida]|jgi:multicomponent K+:H+ antiporter subunit G|uniref:Monovalent cation/H+ antiporter subunit G n=1 Tax=Blastochloris tepida TaxID=2233851 RepID=A0A348FW81_9HYPH|nr:Na+/H+ antiporter subunit G [Blastochloris tepida]BBF91564.1 monovalent cation/H+ antiporter subunit G [Blastochloris tepida]